MVDPTTCTVVLVRRRRGCGEAGRVVHVVAMSDGTPPDPSLAGCREIDIFGAVRTTLHAAADAEGGCGT